MKKSCLVLLALLMLALPSTYAQDPPTPPTRIHTTDDGAFALAYLPDGWAFGGDAEGVYVASDPTLLVEAAVLQRGDVRLLLAPIAVSDAQAIAPTPLEQFEVILAELAADAADPVLVSEIADYPDYGAGALLVYGANSRREAHVVYYPLAPGYWGLAYISTSLGELDGPVGETAWLVLNSIFFSLPLDATHHGDTLSFAYPTGWFINTANAPLVTFVTTAPSALEIDTLTGDEAYLLVSDISRVGIDIQNLELKAAATAFALTILREDEVIDTPYLLEIDGRRVALIEIYNRDDASVGGVIVGGIAGPRLALYAVGYITPPGRGIEMFYTASQVLASIAITTP